MSWRKKAGPQAQPHKPGNGQPADDVAEPEAAEEIADAAGNEAEVADASDDEAGLAPAEPDVAEQLAAERQEYEDLHDRFLRQGAEFHNYRKRSARERDQLVLEARASLIERLLPIVDNLERALAAEAADGSLRDGVVLVHRELMAQLEAEGVSVENPTRRPFDPERHEALAHERVPGYEDGTVVEVFRKGYLLGDRLLRPALVKVAKGEEDPAAEGGASEAGH